MQCVARDREDVAADDAGAKEDCEKLSFAQRLRPERKQPLARALACGPVLDCHRDPLE